MFFKLFKNTFLGIDIGTTAIKIVELSKKARGISMTSYGILEKYGHLERVNDAVQTPNLKLLEDSTALLITELLKKSKIQTKEALIGLPNFLGFTTTIKMPNMSSRDLSKAIKYQAEQYIPMPLKETTLDWQILEEGPELKILLIAVPTEHIKRYMKTAELAKLNLLSLELESTAVSRLIGMKEKGSVLIIDIGGRMTSISVLNEGKLRFTSDLEIGGGDFTRVMANGLAINPLRAEQLKKTYGLNLNFERGINLSNLLQPLLESIFREAEKAINTYYLNEKMKVEKVILIGGGANLIGFSDLCAQRLALPVAIGDPFSWGMIDFQAEITPIIRELAPILTPACAIGLKGLL